MNQKEDEQQEIKLLQNPSTSTAHTYLSVQYFDEGF